MSATVSPESGVECRPRMYEEFADLWPLFSAPEDYVEEARYWRQAWRFER